MEHLPRPGHCSKYFSSQHLSEWPQQFHLVGSVVLCISNEETEAQKEKECYMTKFAQFVISHLGAVHTNSGNAKAKGNLKT